jgi:hypothetical protein
MAIELLLSALNFWPTDRDTVVRPFSKREFQCQQRKQKARQTRSHIEYRKWLGPPHIAIRINQTLSHQRMNDGIPQLLHLRLDLLKVVSFWVLPMNGLSTLLA